MISIKFDFDKEKFAQQLKASAMKVAKETIEKKASAFRCPTHGEAAKLEFVNSSGSQLEYKIHACCDSAIEAVKASLCK